MPPPPPPPPPPQSKNNNNNNSGPSKAIDTKSMALPPGIALPPGLKVNAAVVQKKLQEKQSAKRKAEEPEGHRHKRARVNPMESNATTTPHAVERQRKLQLRKQQRQERADIMANDPLARATQADEAKNADDSSSDDEVEKHAPDAAKQMQKPVVAAPKFVPTALRVKRKQPMSQAELRRRAAAARALKLKQQKQKQAAGTTTTTTAAASKPSQAADEAPKTKGADAAYNEFMASMSDLL
eukprot:TRINITY_DN66170_c16_g1_i1.p1 TRINITY_DN66170_c16_g1~~TRINITY_DN66170_c16_g1_i1.p1  ORF type:complete len:240 (+),score=93.98 TRINITY_DN66170_c16_g1_i1:141-860(+)